MNRSLVVDVDGGDFLKITYVMACSVQHIHANGVLHRDIALRNFVLSRDGMPVLIDFGLSRGVRLISEGRGLSSVG